MTRRSMGDRLCCDRCGRSVELREYEWAFGWGHILASAMRDDANVPINRFIGDKSSHCDLCPPCSNELFAWWGSPQFLARETE